MNAILVAIQDPALHPEAMHIAAATGRPIVDATEPSEIARLARTADAILVDADAAPALDSVPPRGGIYFLVGDPGPIDWKQAMRCGATDAMVIPAQSPELLRALGRSRNPQNDSRQGMCLGFLGAVGGAGTSVAAAATALRRAASHRCALIDAAPHSGGLDLVLGIESEIGARWGDVDFRAGTLDTEDVVKALPARGNLHVLTSVRAAQAGITVGVSDRVNAIESVRRIDTVVDLPAWSAETADIAASCTALVLVVPAELRAMSAAALIRAELKAQLPNLDVLAVLRHRGWSGLDLDEAAQLSGLKFVTEIPTVAGLAKDIETRGLAKAPRALARAADDIFAAVGAVP